MQDIIITEKDVRYLTSDGVSTYTFWVFKNGKVISECKGMVYFCLKSVPTLDITEDVWDGEVDGMIASYAEGMGTEVEWSGTFETDNIATGILSYHHGKVVFIPEDNAVDVGLEEVQ